MTARCAEPINTPILEIGGTGWRHLYLKVESRQISGAFKYRGAFAATGLLAPGQEVVCASSGNHALGLAWVALQRGFTLTAYLPFGAAEDKIRKLADAGARTVLVPGGYDACESAARKHVDGGRAFFVHGYNDQKVLEGNRQLFRECQEALPSLPGYCFLPVGGGGLLTAGLMEWGETATHVVGVEHVASPSLTRSLANGEFTVVAHSSGLPDGLLVSKKSESAYRLCRKVGAPTMLVTDDDTRCAMRVLWQSAGIRAEPAGAVALAACLSMPHSTATALCVVTGGNIGDTLWRSLVDA